MPIMKRSLRFLAILLFLIIAAGYGYFVWPLHDKHPAVQLGTGSIAIQGATIYVSPDLPPITNATLLATDGRIVGIGERIEIPKGAQILACNHCAVTAAFWNSHVHFTEPKWSMAPWANSDKLNVQLADMLTSRGFATVIDLGSDPRITISLRHRIETGGLNGPYIYTAGPALYPENGIPFYIRENTPQFVVRLMDQPVNAQESVKDVRRNIRIGTDVLKLFTGSYVEHNHIVPMKEEVARAAVSFAHQQGQVSFAHPSNLEGVKVALNSGVDVLAHAPDTTDGIDDALIAQTALKMAMIPTLKMFGTTVTKRPEYLEPIYKVVRNFRQDGGTLIFGTDVGYMTDYSTVDEFAALAQCGLTSMDILRMLTVNPAKRMGVLAEKGTLEKGKLADFVVLSSDPGQDPMAFAGVQATIRSGKLIWPLQGK